MNRLQALYASLYSRDLYRDVADNWKGIGRLYLLLLLSLTWMPSAVRVAFIITIGCLRLAVRSAAESRLQPQPAAASTGVIGL